MKNNTNNLWKYLKLTIIGILILLNLIMAIIALNIWNPQVTLTADGFTQWDNYRYYYTLPFPFLFTKSDSDGIVSDLTLLENGKKLPGAHAKHADISQIGLGLYSHWGTRVYFSSSDNSNPNTNNRTYTITFTYDISLARLIQLLFISVLIIGVLLFSHKIRAIFTHPKTESSYDKKLPAGKMVLFSSIIIFILLIFMLVTTEVALRLSGNYSSWTEKNGGEYAPIYSNKNRLIEIPYRGPNISTRYNQPEFHYKIETNSLGIRDIEHPIEKLANEYRIVALGDSFTEGMGAPFHQTWPKSLEKLLNNKLDRKVTAILGGMSGSDPAISYKVLQDKLLKYQPDMVILAINDSDLDDFARRGGLDRFSKDHSKEFEEKSQLEWWFSKSHTFRFILMDIFGYDWNLHSPKQSKDRLHLAHKELTATIIQFQKLANEKQFQFILVIHPYISHLFSSGDFAFSYLIPILEKNNIRYINLIQYFRETVTSKDASKYFWPKDGHCKPAGYEHFAQGIFTNLFENRWLQFPGK